jgi:hypothetical protein
MNLVLSIKASQQLEPAHLLSNIKLQTNKLTYPALLPQPNKPEPNRDHARMHRQRDSIVRVPDLRALPLVLVAPCALARQHSRHVGGQRRGG